MNTITAEALLKKRNEIYKKKQRNSNKVAPRNENINEDSLQAVSDMNTFKRKLESSLRQGIFPPITSPSPQHIRRDTLFEEPINMNLTSSDSFSIPTQSKIRKRSQSHQVHTDVQTEAISLDIEDMYSMFNINKKNQNYCRKSSIRYALITLGATVYSIGLVAFQYYIICNNN